MVEKKCAVCGKILDDSEVRLNERSQKMRRGIRYLCRQCRQKEYNNYTKSIKNIINKKM